MPSRLDNLLAAIAPANTLDDVGARVDAAMNSFDCYPVGLQAWDWDDLEEYLGRFFQHVACTAFRLRTPTGDAHTHLCMHAHVLEAEYGRNWSKIVLRLVRTGAEGGLPVVLRIAARRLIERWSGNRTGSLLSDYWENLSEDEQQGAAEEYLEKYGSLLSREVREQLAAYPSFALPRVLEQHPQLVARARRLGR